MDALRVPLIVPAALALAAAVVTVAAGVGSGQAPVVLELQVQGTPPEMGPGEAAEVAVLARNAGRVDGRLVLQVRATEAWSVQAPPALDVPAGASRELVVRVVAPDAASAAPLRGEVVGVLTDAAGLAPARASAPLQATFVAPLPPPPPPDFTPVFAGVAGLAVLGGAAWWRRGGAVAVRLDGPTPTVRPGAEAYIPVEVRNLAFRTRTVHLRPGRAPEGWIAGTNLAEVTLPPRGAQRAWLAVRAPGDAPADAREVVQVEAWPAGGRKVQAAMEVRVGAAPAPKPAPAVRPFAASA